MERERELKETARQCRGLSSLATISTRPFYLASSFSSRPETNQLALRQPYCVAVKAKERNKNEMGSVVLESRWCGPRATRNVEETKEKAEVKESFATRASDYLRRSRELTPQSGSPSFLPVVMEYSLESARNARLWRITLRFRDGFLVATFWARCARWVAEWRRISRNYMIASKENRTATSGRT